MNKKAIFFDLDGTLFDCELNEMFELFFELLKKHGALKTLDEDTEKAFEIYNQATHYMFNNSNGRLVSEVFFEYITKVTGKKREDVFEFFNDFYAGDFKKISALIKAKPIQKQIIDTARKKGYIVVLATMPVFPISASKSRLGEIGLSVEEFDYISHFDNSYYLKPDERYYKQILETLNLKAQECIMVGNDVKDDMCTQKMGFEVFFVTGCNIGTVGENIKSGDLYELLSYIESLDNAV